MAIRDAKATPKATITVTISASEGETIGDEKSAPTQNAMNPITYIRNRKWRPDHDRLSHLLVIDDEAQPPECRSAEHRSSTLDAI
jgi:hypothetical protein